MKVETETGFEPDLLLEMYKSPKLTETKAKNGRKKVKRERGFINKCVVLKDRTDTLNGKEIESPKFKDFMPIIKFLNIGGEHHGVDTSRTSESAFKDRDWSYSEMQKRREIALETLQEALILGGLDGRSEDNKKKRTEALITAFGTSAKTALENMKPTDLENGVLVIRKLLALDTEPLPPTEDKSEQLPF